MSKQRPSHVPVFISSTYEDLREYREAIQKVLVRLETIIKGMEFFGSRPGTPSSECLQVVEQSKIFLCVIGMRLGSIDDTTKKSIVQLEYEKAQDLKLPTLIYMIDEKTQPILPIYMDIGKKAKQLKEFKQLLKKRHVVSFVTSPEDLALKVSQDLPSGL